MTSACFTGHRNIDEANILHIKTLLDKTICALARRGVTEFYCGGALGWDTICANMVLYLCSDMSGFITGENICIDGGMTKQMIYHADYGWKLEAE